MFDQFAKNDFATARAQQFIENQFVCTNIAENVKKLRFNQGHRTVQKKQIILVGKCRKMIFD